MNNPTISISLHKCRKTYYIEIFAIAPRYFFRIPCSNWKRLSEILKEELDTFNLDVGIVANYTRNKMPTCVHYSVLHPTALVCDFSRLPVELIKEYLDYINNFEGGVYCEK